jgi:hypothetical protein
LNFCYENSRLILSFNQYITRQNAFLSFVIDLYPILLITLSFHELYKRLSFPVSNSSWLILMCMQTIQSKKETNYRNYNCCTVFYSSVACVSAFREKKYTRKRFSILIVQQFLYIRLLVRSRRNSGKWGNRSYVICLWVDTSYVRKYIS